MPDMSENEVPKAWSEYYKPEYTREEIKRHLSNFRFFLAKCEEHFGGRRILEIGTGSGIVAAHFVKRGYEVAGLDYDPGVIEIGKRVSRSMETTPSFAVGDMFHPPFRPASFDACYHQGLMEHFDPPEIVRALTAQLQIARKVIFAVPTSRWHGGVRGDERIWPGSRWNSLLADFKILDIFALGYHDLPSRVAFYAGTRFTGLYPKSLFRTLAIHRAAQIGFVITARG